MYVKDAQASEALPCYDAVRERHHRSQADGWQGLGLPTADQGLSDRRAAHGLGARRATVYRRQQHLPPHSARRRRFELPSRAPATLGGGHFARSQGEDPLVAGSPAPDGLAIRPGRGCHGGLSTSLPCLEQVGGRLSRVCLPSQASHQRQDSREGTFKHTHATHPPLLHSNNHTIHE